MQIEALSLLELNKTIKDVLKEHTLKKYWVIGEISELKVNNSGHCYLELIQKNKESDHIVARSRATIWATTFRMIKPYFETTTGHALEQGLGILVKVSVDFHEVFGISLNITDIEPTFTVGELAIKKQKIIERLTAEGVIGMNMELDLPRPCQKIAIISSATAAGYGDFVDQLINNTTGFKFYCKLFPAVMQGEEAEKSIISALDKVYSSELTFDCVVIIRGGGSQADLSCFDSYWLAYHITQFPLPVLTGIGHEQDDSIVDMVSHTRLKTPTAVAAFLIDSMLLLYNEILDIQNQLVTIAQDYVYSGRNSLVATANNLKNVVKTAVQSVNTQLLLQKHKLVLNIQNIIHREEIRSNAIGTALGFLPKQIVREQFSMLENRKSLIKQSCSHLLNMHEHLMDSTNSRIQSLDPSNILKRGYSITFKEGIIVRDAEQLAEGEIIETQFHKGKIGSIVKSKNI